MSKLIKRTLLTLGLLATTTLAGCVVAAPRRPVVYVDPPGPVIVAPVFPVYGWYGGYYHSYGYYRGGGGYRGGGHWH